MQAVEPQAPKGARCRLALKHQASWAPALGNEAPWAPELRSEAPVGAGSRLRGPRGHRHSAMRPRGHRLSTPRPLWAQALFHEAPWALELRSVVLGVVFLPVSRKFKGSPDVFHPFSNIHSVPPSRRRAVVPSSRPVPPDRPRAWFFYPYLENSKVPPNIREAPESSIPSTDSEGGGPLGCYSDAQGRARPSPLKRFIWKKLSNTR